ncbi:MAG TPA: terminase family protein [Allosphingosinicella sp.]|nr:terminase family protein [Allosphingosinicella sp.]
MAMGEDAGRKRRGKKVRRFTAERRAKYLEHLRRTGNHGAAARAIGLDRCSAENRRKRDAEFAIGCMAAVEEASRRLAGATDTSDGVADAEFERVKRNRHGRLMIVRTRKGKWCKSMEVMFLDVLRQCGNIAASARAVGVTSSLIWQRRRDWPGFRQKMEEALEEAEVVLEFRLATLGNNVGAGVDAGETEAGEMGTVTSNCPPNCPPAEPFDPELAMRFLKWREEKRRARGRRGRAAAPPTIEEVTERIVRKVEAIKRHRGERREGVRHRAVEALEELGEGELRRVLAALSEVDRRALDSHWPEWAHSGQLPPHDAWRIWVLLAGRGFGKTRAGAEWVSDFVREMGTVTSDCPLQIALVGATVEEARAVMVEGRSGLLAVARAEERAAMRWEPSRRRLAFASGAQAFLYSAANPESLRGPEHHLAWCDELAKWRRGQATWDNLRLGLRLGGRPRALVTTTPRPVPLLKRIMADPLTVLSGGATRANPHLPGDFIAAVEDAHAGTRFGRQELEGMLIEDVEGALWRRELIERSRIESGGCPHFCRVVIGVDPPASAEGDACGIVVAGLGEDGIGYVLADLTVAGLSPEGWARKVAAAAEAWGAHRVIAEKNNGGAMVGTVLRGADVGLPVTLVHAADRKVARAEPVAVLFESGKAKFAGRFAELEDELAGLTYGGGYQGPGRSPDRADALVWAMTELMVKPGRAPPRVRGL